MRNVLLSTDWHGGNRSREDRCDWEKVRAVVRIAVDPQFDVGEVVVSEILDVWKWGLAPALAGTEPLLREVGAALRAAKIPTTLVPGNHEPRAAWQPMLVALNGLGWEVSLEDDPSIGFATPAIRRGPFVVTHGHEFDPINRDPWLTPIARGVTFLAGQIEKRLPRFNESALSLERLVTPAARRELDDPVHHRAAKAAAERHLRIAMGHTHWACRLAGEDLEGRRWSVTNAGACDVDAAETTCVLLRLDVGRASIIRPKKGAQS